MAHAGHVAAANTGLIVQLPLPELLPLLLPELLPEVLPEVLPLVLPELLPELLPLPLPEPVPLLLLLHAGAPMKKALAARMAAAPKESFVKFVISTSSFSGAGGRSRLSPRVRERAFKWSEIGTLGTDPGGMQDSWASHRPIGCSTPRNSTETAPLTPEKRCGLIRLRTRAPSARDPSGRYTLPELAWTNLTRDPES
jgi:hypothetical protein